ncbi:hypothetical protein Taro_028125 [Colocasia esculenta]|uniref:Uncharacterized protein n=1 Tax=Colocasia esculenta TaxID=4460 RepID=A0A843VHN0_COLES|nr:hypothetical protein [Colocasia esculenta]
MDSKIRKAQHNRNERGAILRETLTRTITNGSGKPHQNTGQPSDAPQARGQCNSNQKRAQQSENDVSPQARPPQISTGSRAHK